MVFDELEVGFNVALGACHTLGQPRASEPPRVSVGQSGGRIIFELWASYLADLPDERDLPFRNRPRTREDRSQDFKAERYMNNFPRLRSTIRKTPPLISAYPLFVILTQW